MVNKKLLLCLYVLVLSANILFANGFSEEATSNNSEDIRIISLSPEATEIICALGSENNLIGRTEYCDYPESVKDIQSVGDLFYPNIELIISLKPDIVIATSIISKNVYDSLSNAGIKVYQLNYQNEGLEGCYGQIQEIGSIIGKNNEAKEIVESLKNKILEINKKVSNIIYKKSCVVLVTWGDWGDYAAPKDSYVDGAIKAAGGINIASEGNLWTISKEFLLSSNPDVIFITNDSNYVSEDDICNVFKNTEPYSLLNASKTNNIFVLNGNSINRQALRIFDAIEEMSKYLYPELY